MDNNGLLYCEPEVTVQANTLRVNKAQAIKAMIFGLVALTVAELPYFLGLLVAPPFAIIALCMAADFKRKYPGQATGFVKAAKVTSIISLPLCVITGILSCVSIFALSAASYYC